MQLALNFWFHSFLSKTVWSGRYIEEDGQNESSVTAAGNSLSITIPILKIEGGHAQYVGQDVAFMLYPVD